MKSIRLLPVVIFAALALLIFKGIGLATNGGYVLTGPVAVVAAEHEAGGGEAAAVDADMAAPGEVTLTDSNPVLDDTAPTLATRPEAGEHGAPAAMEAEASHDATEPAADEAHTAPSSSEAPAGEIVACPTAVPAEGEHASSEDAGHAELSDNIGTALATGCAPLDIPVNEHGDAVPTIQDANGNIVPLETADGETSQTTLTGRLSDRRAELDTREAELDMRASLIEAAEQRLNERTQQLAALEAQVAALVDEKQAVEEAGFKAVVSMYETMKPKDAAKIFDTLKLPVLLKVARAMSPRKMSPVLAAMSAGPAQALTTAMASVESVDVAAKTGENLAALPQIVGQ